MKLVEEYTCDRCLTKVEAHRVVSMREQHGAVIVEHYCECMVELRLSVFDQHDGEVARLCGEATLPYRPAKAPIPQVQVERLVRQWSDELDAL